MQTPIPKPQYVERIKMLLKDEEDVKKFFEIAKTSPKRAIRVNTLKITPQKLIERLNELGWEISQPFQNHPEIMIIQSELAPGELGKACEHLLGYYYVQEITSMMPIIALTPNAGEFLLDLCAAPGSKTSQAAAMMENQGTIIANDINIGRISILSANLEKLGITNTIITRHSAVELCGKLQKIKMQFDKILVDAPCSGEGNLRTSPNTLLAWSEGLLKNLSKKQKHIASSAISILKTGNEMIYSTCSYAPEENELVIQHLLDNHNIEILPVQLPLKTRPGITEWQGRKLSLELKKCARIYHHDTDMEGFFLCKLKKLGDQKNAPENPQTNLALRGEVCLGIFSDVRNARVFKDCISEHPENPKATQGFQDRAHFCDFKIPLRNFDSAQNLSDFDMLQNCKARALLPHTEVCGLQFRTSIIWT